MEEQRERRRIMSGETIHHVFLVIMSILLNEPTSERKLINWLIYNSYHVAKVDRLFIHVFSLYRSQHERNY